MCAWSRLRVSAFAVLAAVLQPMQTSGSAAGQQFAGVVQEDAVSTAVPVSMQGHPATDITPTERWKLWGGQYGVAGDGPRQSLCSAAHNRWSVTSANGSVSVSATVPGQIHFDLERAGVINDTYALSNVDANAWVRADSWSFALNFTLSTELAASKKIWLVFDGVDTAARIFLNVPPLANNWSAWGPLLKHGYRDFVDLPTDVPGLRAEDMYLRYVYDVSEAIKRTGTNSLVVEIASVAPLDLGAGRTNQPYAGHSGFNTGSWRYVRKEPSQFGWDWAPVVETQGIWKPVYLVGASQVLVLDTVATVTSNPSDPQILLTESTAKWRVKVITRVNLTAASSVKYSVAGNWSDSSAVSQVVKLPAGVSTINTTLYVTGVQLWWPHGMGAQPLYCVKVTTQVEGTAAVQIDRNIGFRSIGIHARLATNTTPQLHQYRVNGVPFFAKGANWVPPDSLHAKVTDDALCSYIESARNANFNFLRVWGGGDFPASAFFDCADQYGIFIQQDGIISDAVYADTPSFVKKLAEEGQYQARRLASHPSLFMWSGSNEVDLTPTQLNAWFGNISTVDQSRPVWPSCPAFPWKSGVDSGGLPNGQKFVLSQNQSSKGPGEMHSYWFEYCEQAVGGEGTGCRKSPCGCEVGGYTCQDDAFYKSTSFASEYGWVGMPSVESLMPVIGSVETDYLIDSPALVYRQNGVFTQNKVYNVVKYFFGRLGAPHLNKSSVASFRRVVHMSQVMQSACIQAETEHYRRGRDTTAKTGGALYWMMNDVWPAPSWSSIEYGGRRKMLHYVAKRFYAAISLSSYCEPSIKSCKSVAISINSDNLTVTSCRLSVSFIRWRDGVETVHRGYNLTVQAQGAATVQINDTEFSAALLAAGCSNTSACFMTANLTDSASGEAIAPDAYQWLSDWNNAQLQPTALTLATRPSAHISDAVEVTVSSSAMAPNVMVHCSEPTDFGWFSDNALTLRPGENVTVTYTPRKGPLGTGIHTPCTSTASFYAVSVNGLSSAKA